jgi:bifunctional enzyme CysN/CysC
MGADTHDPQVQEMTKAHLKTVFVGHVDHGKSSLIGRLFHDTGSLREGKVEAIRAMCERRGMPFEWAFLMDALQAERDQAITIDSAEIRFRAEGRDYVIIDAPGHREFLKNMISGAASADAALLVVDADEGVMEGSRRHGYLLHLLGVRQVAVLVNKMDRVDYDKARFAAVERELGAYLEGIGVQPHGFIPVSAREGDNIATRSANLDWYKGPTLVETLASFRSAGTPTDLPLRFPIQDVYKFDDRRIIAGRVESGRLRVGDSLLFSPSNKTARIRSIENWNEDSPRVAARAGQSVGITLDEQIFIERGDVASHAENPPIETNVFRGHLFWLGGKPLSVGDHYTLRMHTCERPVVVQSIERIIDISDLSHAQGKRVEQDGVAEVVLRSRGLIALDEFVTNPLTGRFVLIDGTDIAGGGIVHMEGYPDRRAVSTVRATNVNREEHRIPLPARWDVNLHKSGILWFTGLSGSGKSTLALELERRLFHKGYQVYVLDGDNLRRGLNSNLGFSPEDRAENIRRVGEVAALFARAGFVVITAFISPYRADREQVRKIGGEAFHEIHIQADLELCEQRDPKGLYKKARSGEIRDFTGVSSPYEVPENPDLSIDTGSHSVDECIAQLIDYAEQRLRLREWEGLQATESVDQLAAPGL